jgi:hypothetical protein
MQLDMLLALPMYLMFRIVFMRIARPDHPWRARPAFFTWRDWTRGRTRIVIEGDFIM